MKDQRNNGEFHRADPAWRRRMQVLLVAITIAGIAAVVALNLWLARMASHGPGGPGAPDYQHSLYVLMSGLCLALGLSAAVFAIWLFRAAAATKAERRWPPSSMRTSADVRIRYLTSADALIAQMRAGAFALAVLAVGLFGWSVWLLRTG